MRFVPQHILYPWLNLMALVLTPFSSFSLGERDFYRARIGIGRPVSGKPVADYVLSDPSRSEQGLMLSAFDLLDLQMDKIVTGDFSAAMSALNK